jgi:hypothetical protein
VGVVFYANNWAKGSADFKVLFDSLKILE